MSYSSYLQFPELQYLQQTVSQAYFRVSQWLQKHQFFIMMLKFFWMVVYESHARVTKLTSQLHASDTDIIQTACIMSHGITIVLFIKLFFSNSTLNYELSSLCIILTYVIVTYRHILFILEHNGTPVVSLVKSDNTYLLATSLLMVNSPNNAVKLLPFVLYSSLNMYNWLMGEVLKSGAVSKIMESYYNKIEENVLLCASVVELVVLLAYLKDCMYNFNWLVIYASILFLRVDSSESLNTTTRVLIQCVGRLVKQEIKWDPQPKRGQRIASVNFEAVEVINDL